MLKNRIIGCTILAFSQMVQAKCFVNFDIQCAPLSTGSVAWAPRTPNLREKLLNSTDVQGNAENCQLFSQLIKTECSIASPMQMVFTPEPTGSKQSLFVNKSNFNLYAQRSQLPPAFQTYFNANSSQDTVATKTGFAQQAGQINLDAVANFLQVGNQNTTFTFPMACDSTSNFSACGIEGRCEFSFDSRVGDRYRLTKIGGAFCNYTEIREAVLSQLSRFAANSFFNSSQQVTYAQTKISNFTAFGSMPLISQVDGYLQGLTVEKYGINLATPGLCVPTSQAMMAVGLKSVSPYSRIGNKFDGTSPVDMQNVRSNISDANSNAKKRYQGFAVHVDEIARAGGLLTKFPDKYTGYQTFYNDPRVSDPAGITSTNFDGYKIFFDNDYAQNLPKMAEVEAQYKNWLSDNRGATLALQSTHASSYARYAGGAIIGHSITINGYSGANMIAFDPWKVTSHLQFANYTYPNAGQTLESLPGVYDKMGNNYANTDICNASIKQKCDYDTINCYPRWVNLTGNVTIVDATCSFSGTAGWTDANDFKTKCLARYNPCVTQRIIAPVGSRKMLTFAGATPGYVGQNVPNSKTAAYIRGFMNAAPWPASRTKDEVRQTMSNVTITENRPVGQTCTALTRADIVISGKKYRFQNPIPVVRKDLNQVSSSTPVQAPCRSFREVLTDGETSASTAAVDFIGSLSVTCANGVMTVSSSACTEMAKLKVCTLPNAKVANLYPYKSISSTGFEYFAGFSGCIISTCNPKFVLRSNACIAFKDSCAAGTVYVDYASTTAPVCVSADSAFTIENPSSVNYSLKTSTGKTLAQLNPSFSVYGVDSQGYLVFKKCVSDNYRKIILPSGVESCEPNPQGLIARAANERLSSGKDSTGACRPGFVKDYENKFCVSTLSSCELGSQAIGLMTFDPQAVDRCRFMGCYDGFTPVKWRAPSLTRTYSLSSDGTQSTDPEEFSRYMCTNQPSIQLPVDNIGLVETRGGLRYLAASPLDSAKGYLTGSTCLPNSGGGSGLTVRVSTGTSTYRDVCLKTAGTIYTGISENKSAAAEPLPILDHPYLFPPYYSCNGSSDSLLVSEDGKCLENLKAKREMLGECLIPNGKGLYDRASGRCKVAACHPGFVSSLSELACLDLSRQCLSSTYYSTSTESYLGQIQIGFASQPTPVCMIPKTAVTGTQKLFSQLTYDQVLRKPVYFEWLVGHPTIATKADADVIAINTLIKNTPASVLGAECTSPTSQFKSYFGLVSNSYTLSLWGIECRAREPLSQRYYIDIFGVFREQVLSQSYSPYAVPTFVIDKSLKEVNLSTASNGTLSSKNSMVFSGEVYSQKKAAFFYTQKSSWSIGNSALVFNRSGALTYSCENSSDKVFASSVDGQKYCGPPDYYSSDTVFNNSPPRVACQLSQLDSYGQTVTYAKGYMSESGCSITTCYEDDPFLGGNLYNVGYKFYSYKPTPTSATINGKFKSCVTAPMNLNEMILSNDFSFVRKADSANLCNVVSNATGAVLVPNYACEYTYLDAPPDDIDWYQATFGAKVGGLAVFNQSQKSFDEPLRVYQQVAVEMAPVATSGLGLRYIKTGSGTSCPYPQLSSAQLSSACTSAGSLACDNVSTSSFNYFTCK